MLVLLYQARGNMQSNLDFVLICVFFVLWALGLWLVLFPDHAQSVWLRLFPSNALVRHPLLLRIVGALWFSSLTFVFWFNMRSRAGR
jgi:hypothetical protein